jgi:hypothetical protein
MNKFNFQILFSENLLTRKTIIFEYFFSGNKMYEYLDTKDRVYLEKSHMRLINGKLYVFFLVYHTIYIEWIKKDNLNCPIKFTDNIVTWYNRL